MPSIDRKEIDRARHAILGSEADELPLCTAPFASLVLDADGGVRACEAATTVLAPPSGSAAEDLRRVFHGAEFASLRGALTEGLLPPDHCAACLRCLASDLTEHASLVREYGGLEPRAGSEIPRHLLVHLDNAEEPIDAERLVRRVESLIDDLEEIEVVADAPYREPVFAGIQQLLYARPEESRPRLVLRLRDCSGASRNGLRPARIRLIADAAFQSTLAACHDVVAKDGEVVVSFLLDGSNWFEVFAISRDCAAAGAKLELRAADATGRAPIVELPLAEQRALSTLLGSFWSLFVTPAGSVPDAYDQLRREVRQLVIDHADREARGGRDHALLDGAGANLALPGIEHAMLRDRRLAMTLLHALMGMPRSGTLVEWCEAQLDHAQFAEIADDRPWIRLMLQRVTAAMPTQAAFRLGVNSNTFLKSKTNGLGLEVLIIISPYKLAKKRPNPLRIISLIFSMHHKLLILLG